MPAGLGGDSHGITIERWDAERLPRAGAREHSRDDAVTSVDPRRTSSCVERHAALPPAQRIGRGAHVPDRRGRRARSAASATGRSSTTECPAWETGWSVEPAWQGRGIAREALRAGHPARRRRRQRATCSSPIRASTTRASNALCRSAGFEHRGSATDAVARRRADLQHLGARHVAARPRPAASLIVDERFDGRRPRPHALVAVLHAALGVARRRPQPAGSIGDEGLELRIDEDTAPWAPDLDGDIRVSHLQTGQFSGPVGSDDRPAPVPHRTRRARRAAREAAVARAPRRDRGAAGRHPASRCHGRVLADRLRGQPRRLRRTVHRRDLRQPTSTTTAAGSASASSRRTTRGCARTSRRSASTATSPAVPRLRRRVDSRARAILHRRTLGEDRGAVDRLSGAADARRLRVPARGRHARRRRAAARAPRGAGAVVRRRADERPLAARRLRTVFAASESARH